MSGVFEYDTFKVKNLGECTHPSPLDCCSFISDNKHVSLENDFDNEVAFSPKSIKALEQAGPREKLFYNPAEISIAIITCGGLCPGLNNVIRGIVMCSWHRYGVRRINGYKYGFQGLNPATSKKIELDPRRVSDIHRFGGTILGSSRGRQDINVMVDFLVSEKIDILFCLGGDGTQKGNDCIAEECMRRGLNISCIGIPKTIDNDIMYVSRTFGFITACSLAQAAISSAHEEARGAPNGIGIVKLMGRDSGFIALTAALASADVNLVLLPEVEFTHKQVSEWVYKRLENSDHCVIVVAEGASQQEVTADTKRDASGNVVYSCSGMALKSALGKYLDTKDIDYTIKYIDPSYTIRSAPANPSDAVFSLRLAQMAVHAGLCGRTGMIVGEVRGQFVHIPIQASVAHRKIVDVKGSEYQALLDNTGMPSKWD